MDGERLFARGNTQPTKASVQALRCARGNVERVGKRGMSGETMVDTVELLEELTTRLESIELRYEGRDSARPFRVRLAAGADVGVGKTLHEATLASLKLFIKRRRSWTEARASSAEIEVKSAAEETRRLDELEKRYQ
jgi:hypothetical protein